MHDPNSLPLIAQEEHGGGTTEHPSDAHTGTSDTHAAPAGEGGTGAIFTKLLGELGDHHEISFGHTTLFQLPVILIDDGFHVYPSIEAMQEAGKYEFTHHHIHRAGTEQPPALDMSVTSLVFFQWLAMALLLLILAPMGAKVKKAGVRPLKGFFNAVEAVILYVRDQIVLPNTGEAGKKWMPVFLTFFFFILAMNLIGLVPGGHSATGSLNVTAGLAIIAFFVIQFAAIFKNGLGTWLKHLTGGVPVWLWPIMVPVEVLGLFTKPFALCVRLFANMTAGHVILLSLIGLVFVTSAFIPVTIGFSLFINILELLVAFIQAYIFTMLTAVFAGIGMASHDDHAHGGTEHAAAH
jgi:F-type H+-transporting ATPase subunit a